MTSYDLTANASFAESVATTETSSLTCESVDLDPAWMQNGRVTELKVGGASTAGPWTEGACAPSAGGMRGSRALSESEDTLTNEDEGEPCDLGPITLRCCQSFRNMKAVLVCLCLLATIQVNKPHLFATI